MDPLRTSATRLAEALRAGELDPVELVDRHIERIDQVDPHLNAMVARRFERAREEALAARERFATEDQDSLPPFLGVPCTIKEFFQVIGMPRTGGLVNRKGRIEEQDASAVARLRAAGFVILGVSNVPEGGLWMETTNLVYGRTNNPWDLTRTPGGSSGGEGALVASGASPVGLGSDVGGSIRIPAAMCGVIGHKPSGGLVPNSGQFPDILDGTSQFLSTGPLVRHTEDLMPLLRILAGPDAIDPACVAQPLGDPEQVDLTGLNVFPVPLNGRKAADADMQAGLELAAKALAERGAQVREVRLDRFKYGLEIWAAMLERAAETPYAEILGDGNHLRVVTELARHMIGRPRYSLDALVVTAAEQLMGVAPSLSHRFLAEGLALRQQLDELLGDDGVLLHPPYTRPAPRHRGAWTTPFDNGYTALFNVMQSAVTVVPTGFDSRGLPVSVQVIARSGRDHIAIAAAAGIEEALGGWTMAEPRAASRSETWANNQVRRMSIGKEPPFPP